MAVRQTVVPKPGRRFFFTQGRGGMLIIAYCANQPLDSFGQDWYNNHILTTTAHSSTA